MSLTDIIVNEHHIAVGSFIAVNMLFYALKAAVYPFQKHREELKREGINVDYTLLRNITLLPTPFDLIYFLSYKAASYFEKTAGSITKDNSAI